MLQEVEVYINNGILCSSKRKSMQFAAARNALENICRQMIQVQSLASPIVLLLGAIPEWRVRKKKKKTPLGMTQKANKNII